VLDRAGEHRRGHAERVLVDGSERCRPSACSGTTSRLSALSRPGIGTSRPGRTPLLSSNWRRIEREYFAICRRLPTMIGSQRCAAMPIRPSPTTTSAPMLSVPKPRLAIV
jgi:hypothetical protein